MARGIYLVGFSGTGKSTIAQLIGKKLQWPACDIDDLIVESADLTIPVIFEQEGEAGFRVREAEALRAASDSDAFVIATGGGIVVRPENRELMAAKGWVICLEAKPQTIYARIQRQLNGSEDGAIRPMLEASDPLDQIRTLKHTRQSAYALADWTVHTDRLTEEQVALEVIRAWEILEKASTPPQQ